MGGGCGVGTLCDKNPAINNTISHSTLNKIFDFLKQINIWRKISKETLAKISERESRTERKTLDIRCWFGIKIMCLLNFEQKKKKKLNTNQQKHITNDLL